MGSWVYGIFLDGEDAQSPLVLSSFPMTAKAVTETNKQIGSGEATQAEDEDAFGAYIQNQNFPNIGLLTDEEKNSGNFGHGGDPAGALPSLDDSDSDCDGPAANQSVASGRRKGEMRKGEDGNAEGQIWDVIKADGRCGPNPHAVKDTQRKIKEQMPSANARFQYNDVVYNNFTGSYMNLPGMMMALAQDLCSLFKFPANSQKAEREKQTNRTTKAQQITANPDRDGNVEGVRQQADKQTTRKDDQFHAIFQESFIDILCQLLMDMLSSMQVALALVVTVVVPKLKFRMPRHNVLPTK